MPEPAPVAVTIPVYKASPEADEQRCFERICHIFQGYPMVLCHPEGLDLSYYQKHFPGLHSMPMERDYFLNIASYNRLMLSKEFYTAFLGRYEYILICQLDVWVFRNDLSKWLGKGYDYIGAPWYRRKLHLFQYLTIKQGLHTFFRALRNRNLNHCVGNGGFSLRKTDIFFEACRQGQACSWRSNEDYFWSFIAKRPDGKKLKIPSDTEAAEFCLETQARHYMQGRDLPPMAIHAYKKYDYNYWKPFMFKEA